MDNTCSVKPFQQDCIVFYTAHTVTLFSNPTFTWKALDRRVPYFIWYMLRLTSSKASLFTTASPHHFAADSARHRRTRALWAEQLLLSHLPCRLHLLLSSAIVVHFHVHQKLVTFGERWTTSRVAAGKVGHSRTRVVWAVWEPQRMFWNLAWFQLGTLNQNFLTSLVLAA